MFRKLSRRLSYANVMATLGVFIALGGSAYAVNTVTSSDIVDGQVNNSLTTFDVSTFLGADVVDNTLTGADIQESSLGQVPSAANAAKLGGIDASDYVRGAGTEPASGS